MERDWKRLARAIRTTREALGMPRQRDLADAAGVGRQTIVSLESGIDRKRVPQSLGAVEKALGWAPGRALDIVEGRDKAEPPVPDSTPADTRYAEGMPLRVIRELSEGQVVDTEVLDLTRPGSNSRIVVVFKHDAPAADMNREQLREELEEWSRIQRAVRQITFSPPPEDEANEA